MWFFFFPFKFISFTRIRLGHHYSISMPSDTHCVLSVQISMFFFFSFRKSLKLYLFLIILFNICSVLLLRVSFSATPMNHVSNHLYLQYLFFFPLKFCFPSFLFSSFFYFFLQFFYFYKDIICCVYVLSYIF